MKEGWVCPKCGSVFAPWVSECRGCNRPGTTSNVTNGEYGPMVSTTNHMTYDEWLAQLPPDDRE